jgi:hypothetical protein
VDQDLTEDQDTEADTQARPEISEEELSRNRAALRSPRPSQPKLPKAGQVQTRIQQDSSSQGVRVVPTLSTIFSSLVSSHDGSHPMLSDHG